MSERTTIDTFQAREDRLRAVGKELDEVLVKHGFTNQGNLERMNESGTEYGNDDATIRVWFELEDEEEAS